MFSFCLYGASNVCFLFTGMAIFMTILEMVRFSLTLLFNQDFKNL